jgi:hypothetical protein
LQGVVWGTSAKFFISVLKTTIQLNFIEEKIMANETSEGINRATSAPQEFDVEAFGLYISLEKTFQAALKKPESDDEEGGSTADVSKPIAADLAKSVSGFGL